MDNLARNYEEQYPQLSEHFSQLSLLAAEMFSLLADAAATVKTDLLEHPDDKVFTWLLIGYSKSEAPEADTLLNLYLNDDERWVHQLAKRLLQARNTNKT